MRKHARIVIPIALVALFLFGGWTLRNKLAADRQGDWVRATRGDLVTGFEVIGTLISSASDSLGPPQVEDLWNFKISRMAREGSEVKKGEPVLSFDTTELQRDLEEKTAEADESRKQIEKERNDLALKSKDERLALAESEATLRKTSLKLESPPDLVGISERKKAEIEHAIAKRESSAIRLRIEALERGARARIELLESRRSEAEAFVTRTQDAIQKMNVMATRDGTIVYTTSRNGEKRKEGDNVWKADRIIEIPDLNRMKAEGEVDEVDAGRVAVGQRVSLRLDAHPDEEFQGTISFAGRTVQQKRNSQDPLKVLRVEIKLDRTDPAKMRPGMRFQGTIELGRIKNAVLIPRDAVFLGSDGPFVHRRNALKVEQTPVQLGRENDRFVEVLKGLEQGDRVLVTKQDDEEKKS
ncbi:MAG TPA: efflux RND transporter periplasmic adaptor subunit [Thermoanaerobaculia bacterium]|jgi:multidrug efflux pump subunit AcrA (membrane-fusion protein)|nr:efflux RND transporter periplasmic adaptor subunit [Thermoanaerobaculia bacterium]